MSLEHLVVPGRKKELKKDGACGKYVGVILKELSVAKSSIF